MVEIREPGQKAQERSRRECRVLWGTHILKDGASAVNHNVGQLVNLVGKGKFNP